ncbi:MAG TPA: sensor domain-containing diguanylate cyclase [Acidimicrobiales bacterium]|nr:sensor domain-containing diguanylate cyclase [Acidimicrobiales bacterium]
MPIEGAGARPTVGPDGNRPLVDGLRRWLGRHPVALVGLVDNHGQILPWPDDVALGPDHRVDDRSLLDLVVDDDRGRLTAAFLDAVDRGMATTTVRMASQPGTALTVDYFDLRDEIGGLVRLCRTAEGSASPTIAPVEATRPRVAVLTKGPNGEITAVDDDFCRLLGWARAEVVGSRSLSLIHPDDQSRAVDNWMSMVARRGQHTVRLRHRHKDGTYLWLETCNDLRDADPGRFEVRCQLIDVSAEMHAVDALRQQEELLRRVTEAVPVGLAHLAAAGGVTYANTALLRLLDVDGVASLADVLAALPARAADRLGPAVAAVAASGHDTELELDLHPPGPGREARARITLSAVRDGGTVTGVLLCVVDVTDLAGRAARDPLTGTLNRAGILAVLDHALADPGGHVGVAFVDLDDFKRVNDDHGHAAGDELLRRVAAAISEAVRDGDRVGRIGGDEFLVVCPKIPGQQELAGVAARVRGGVAAAGAAASVGTSMAAAGSCAAAELVGRADLAMYRAKRAPAGAGG